MRPWGPGLGCEPWLQALREASEGLGLSGRLAMLLDTDAVRNASALLGDQAVWAWAGWEA